MKLTLTERLIIPTRNESLVYVGQNPIIILLLTGYFRSLAVRASSRGADAWWKTGCIEWYAQSKVQDASSPSGEQCKCATQ